MEQKSLVIQRVLTIFLLSAFVHAVYGQVHRYAVFFTDKGGASNPFHVDNPGKFLTAKSIERRKKQSIGIYPSDLPVYSEYVTQLKEEGIDVYFTSRWVNAAIVQTKKTKISKVASLSFVDSIALIAKGARLNRKKLKVEIADAFKAPTSVRASSMLQLAMLQADKMHNEGMKGQGMLIAVLDDGFRGANEFAPFKHLWVENKIVSTKDFVENSGNVFRLGDHGTSVLSTIAAQYNNEFFGTAYGAHFILCITEEGGSEDRVEEFNWLLGAEYADSLGADIINSSLGYRSFDISEHNYSLDDLDGHTAVVSVAARTAAEKGMVVVVSAGNNGNHKNISRRYISPPADADHIVTVGSVGPDLSYTPFSSVGPSKDGRVKPDVVALGLGTAVVRGNGSIGYGHGTSFASPQVAGLAAGIWQANPGWNNHEVMEAIRNSGHQSHDPDTLLGYGIPSYTYTKEGRMIHLDDVLNEEVSVYFNPFVDNKLLMKVDGPLEGKWEISITNNDMEKVFSGSFKPKKAEKVLEFTVDNLQEGVYYLILRSGGLQGAVKLINF